MNKSSTRKKDNEKRKKEETGKWFKESFRKKENLLNMKSYLRRKIDKKPGECLQVLRIRTVSLQHMKENLTDLFKLREWRRRENSRRTGKSERKPESISFTKYSMTDNAKLKSTREQNRKSLSKGSKIRKKWRGESVNMSPSRKPVIRENTKDRNSNSRNCCKRSPRKKRRDDSSLCSFRRRSNRWKTQGKTIARKSRIERDKGESS